MVLEAERKRFAEIDSSLIEQTLYHPSGARAIARHEILQSWRTEEEYHQLNGLYRKPDLG